MNPIVSKWFKDPNFAGLPEATQRQAVGTFFDQKLVDADFGRLPVEQQRQVRDRFIADHFSQAVAAPAGSGQRGVVDETVSSLASGMASVMEAGAGAAEMLLPESVSDALGTEKFRHAMQRTRQSDYLKRPDYLAEGTVLEHPERLKDWRWWTRALGENIPNMAAMMLPGLGAVKAAQGMKMGTQAIRWMGRLGAWSGAATIEAGYAYGQAKDEMTAAGELSADQIESIATLEGVTVGVANGILEVLPFDNLFLRQSGAAGVLKRVVRQAMLEGGTEVAQEAVGLYVSKLGHKPDLKMLDHVGQMLEAGLVGGVLGGGVSLVAGSDAPAAANAAEAAAAKPDPSAADDPAPSIQKTMAEQPMDGTGAGASGVVAAAAPVDENLAAARKAQVKEEAQTLLDSVLREQDPEPVPAPGAPAGPDPVASPGGRRVAPVRTGAGVMPEPVESVESVESAGPVEPVGQPVDPDIQARVDADVAGVAPAAADAAAVEPKDPLAAPEIQARMDADASGVAPDVTPGPENATPEPENLPDPDENVTALPEDVAADAGREPWQITQADYLADAQGADEVAIRQTAHANHVKQAVMAGKDVPAAVLAAYDNNVWAQKALEDKAAPVASGAAVFDSADRRAEARGPDRRVRVQQRQKISEMTPEQMAEALLVDEKTGLGSERAYQDADKKAVQASVDVDDLKWVNDTFGHEVGDELLAMVGASFRHAGMDAYHPTGDEFWAQDDAEAALADGFEKSDAYLAANPITATAPDGTVTTFRANYSYGLGATLKEADDALKIQKAERKKAGLAAERGAKSAGILEERGARDTVADRAQDGGEEVDVDLAAPEASGVQKAPSAAVAAITGKKATASKREKALAQYQDYVAGLSDVQREQVADLIEADPASPGMQRLKIQRALAGSVVDTPALTTAPADNNIEEDQGGEVTDGAIRRTGETSSEGVQAGGVPGTGTGGRAEPVLPDEGGSGGAAQVGSGSGGDAGVYGGRDRDQRTAGPVDYVITPADELGAGGPKQKFKDNVAAIQLLAELDDRPVTSEDQSKLVKYVGWGGLAQAFVRPDGSVAKGWEREAEQLKGLLDADAYAAARASTQDAHYTSAPIIEGMYAGLKRLGFGGGKVLEPSVGTGNFVGLMPRAMRSRSRITGVELDPTSARIAELLYPQQLVVQSGFQDFSIVPDSFDVALGNPPFGDKTLFDAAHKELKGFSIHNYFFAKSLIGLRPNGVLAMVVSSHMMDKKGGTQRAWFARRADLLGAIRLPNNAFKGNAGTEVTTDILFLRKRAEGEPASGPAWQKIKRVQGADNVYQVNEYFEAHPEMMLGDLAHNKLFPAEVVDGVYQGAPGLEATPGVDFDAALADAITRLPERVYVAGQSAEAVQRPEILVSDVGFAQPYGYALDDNGQAVRRLPDENGRAVFEPVLFSGDPLVGMRLKRFKGLLGVRDALRELVRAEVADAGKARLAVLRDRLNRVYDGFVDKYGLISVSANSSILASDPTDLPLLRSLEVDFDAGVSKAVAKRTGEKVRAPSAKKATIFKERTREPYKPATSAADAKAALAVVLREDGVVDMARLASLAGISEETAAQDLAGLVFLDPATGIYETKENYLSGNVKEKLSAARDALGTDGRYAANVEALEAVIPEDVPPDLISFRVGATWIPSQLYEDFASDVLQVPVGVNYLASVGVWSIQPGRGTSAYDTERMGAGDIYARMLQSSDLAVYDRTRDGGRVLNMEQTTVAKAKSEEIDRAFSDWILSDLDRRERLGRVFNDVVNTTVETRYDGDHMIFPGMGIITAGKARDDQLLVHQKNVVWRLVQKGKGLVDHVVGSGKTFLSIATGLEMKRMGLVKKPMYVVPNHLVGQWALDFQRLYPGANVLVISKKDFAKSKRQEFMGRIATGNWDAVVVAHSSFGFIPMPRDYEKRFYKDQVQQYARAIRELAEAEGKKSRSVKQMEKAKDRLEEKIKRLGDKGTDAVVDFSELGVDALFVDEAHEFKNLFYATRRTRVAGLGNPAGSKKAFDMFVKTQFVLENNNDKGVFLLTGTPVSNSISEMYTMMRYLMYGRMKQMGIRHFDQWANMFASAVSDWEVDPTGTRYRLQTKMDFVNLPGLMSLYRDFADVVSTADLQRWAKERGQVWPIPDVKGGRPENMVAERSDLQKEFMAYIVRRFDNMPADPKEDNPLKATGEAMKAALDMRLIDPSLPDHPGSKVNLAVAQILSLYRDWSEKKGAQLVFCDLSVPKKSRGKHAKAITELKAKMKAAEAKLERVSGDALLSAEAEYEALARQFEKYSPAELMAASSGFSVYDDIREKLIAGGVPPAEVAFIHDANTEMQKEDLFARVRQGRVRVLIGSTSKMGAGMNVQNKLVGLHHLDAPWRPSDLEQREGRIIRQGNEFFLAAQKAGDSFEVAIKRYATKETLDTRRWQIIERKAASIEKLRASEHGWGDTLADALGEAANAAEMKAASSGNPLILKEIQVRKEIEKLEAQRRGERAARMSLQAKLRAADNFLANYDALVADVTADRDLIDAHARGNTPAAWQVAINDRVFKVDDLVPETGSDKEIKAARKQNNAALSDVKKAFKAAAETALAPFFDKTVAAGDTRDLVFTLRGVEFDVVRNPGTNTVDFVPALKGVDAYGFGVGADGFYAPMAEPMSPTGMLVRMNNLLDRVSNNHDAAMERLEKQRTRDEQTVDVAAQELGKSQDDGAAIEALRAEHADILAQLRNEEKTQPKDEQDFSRWEALGGAGVPVAEAADPDPLSGDRGYHIHLPEGGYESVPDAKRVEVVDWLHTFVHKHSARFWSVTEAVTGARLAKGASRKAAIADAQMKLESRGQAGTLDTIKAYLSQHGRSPWGGDATEFFDADVLGDVDAAKARLARALASERGSWSFYESAHPVTRDLVIVGRHYYQRGVNAFQDFVGRMAAALGKAWNKVARFATDLYRIVSNERGEVSIDFNGEAKQPPGPQVTHDLDHDRTFVNKLHEMADVSRENVQAATAKLQLRVQELTGKASRKRIHLGMGYHKHVKESLASRRLDQAMFFYRDLGGDLGKVAEFRKKAEAGLADGSIAGSHKVYVKQVLAALEVAEGLSGEQLAFVDEMADRFEAAYQIAQESKVIQSHVDNYVRRIYKRRSGESEAVVYSGWAGGGHGFSVTHGAAQKRRYDTALDAVLDGYELAVTGLTSSYDNYMRELVTVLANKAFIQRGSNSFDASGRKLFTTNTNKTPGHEDYRELKASGFSAWQLTGTISAVDEKGMGGILETNSWGRKVFVTQPTRVPESWAVYKPGGVRASKVFYANPLYDAEEAAAQWALAHNYSDIRHRDAKEVADQFQKLKLYAPAPIAEMINKMTATDPLFSQTPALKAVARLNAGVKAWILMTSFFHHLAGARSWVFGVHHGWGRGKHVVVSDDGSKVLRSFGDLAEAQAFAQENEGHAIEKGRAAPWRAYKAGLDKVYDLHPLVSMGVKNGLTLGELQDWSESALRDDGGLVERLVKSMGWDRAAGVVERFRFTREKWANSLFKKFFAGLKSEAFVVEYVHELAKAQEQYTAGKGAMPDADKVAERVARLINADFGGLHLKRMGRNPTLQLFSRLMLLAPDWTESNFRTVSGMVPGLNEKISKLIGDVPGPAGMDAVYRRFWGRVMVRIAVSTIVAQLLLNGKDESEEFVKEQMLSNRFNKFRWTEVDVSRLYAMMGIDLEGQRKTFSVGGHFFDPLKLIDPWRLIKGKASPAVRALGAGFSGTDWADRPFTGTKQLLTTGRTVKKSAFEDTEAGFDRLPATVVNQVINMQPIQMGQLMRYLQGEEDGLSALMASAGVHVHTAWKPQSRRALTDVPGYDDVMLELDRLRSAGALRMGPPAKTVMVNGVPQRLSQQVYDGYVRESSAGAAKRLKTLIDGAGYQAWDDDKRAAKVRSVINNARSRARKKIKSRIRRAA